jgi:hypothetical protein
VLWSRLAISEEEVRCKVEVRWGEMAAAGEDCTKDRGRDKSRRWVGQLRQATGDGFHNIMMTVVLEGRVKTSEK